MKKFDFKTRFQVGWYKAACFGAIITVLLVPTVKSKSTMDGVKETGGLIVQTVQDISFGPKVKVMLNGDVVALAKNEEEAESAFRQARLRYNGDGIRILKADLSCELYDKERDREALKGIHVKRGGALCDVLYESFDKYAEKDKELAYTLRIDDYTVTLSSMDQVVSVLERAQGIYDEEDAFQVGLKPTDSQNVSMYEVKVGEKGKMEEEQENVSFIPPIERVCLTGAEVENESGEAPEQGQEEDSPVSVDEENPEEEAVPSEEGEQPDALEGEQPGTQEVAAKVAAQAVNDGVKFVGFAQAIQVMETYVEKNQITKQDAAYEELTAENDTPSIYVVEPGDCLSVIAEKNNMTVEEIREMNPTIESDDDIYFDDRLNVTVPKAAVQILVEKQETYEEEYQADIVYEDDDSMYIGETSVVQEGSSGRHIVTDMVTYKGGIESGRKQLQETVEVAAVAQIVRRGTKSRPTYMYPCTNWNITSNYGYRWGRLHAGTDVGIPTGTTIRASRGGKVTVAGWLGGYGNCVMIDHGDGVTTVYGHLSQVLVSVGQYVDQGEQIALSGNTGRSTGPHLHFEIRVNGVAEDAMPYLYGNK